MIKEIILQLIIVFLQTIFFTFSLINVSKCFSADRYTKRQIFVSFIIILISNTVGNVIKNMYTLSNTLLIFISLFLTNLLILKISKIKSFMIAFSNIILVFISELISFYLLSLLTGKNTAEISSSGTLLSFIIIIENIINYTFLIIYLNLHKRFRHVNLKEIKFSNIQLLSFILILLISTVPQMIIFTINNYSYPKLILITNCIQMLIFCTILLAYFKINIEKEKAKSDLEISELHNKTMVNMVDGVRTLKHDYNNIMQALNGYLSTKQYDKLQEHINKVLDECNIVNNLSVIDQKVFNDPAIYGIVGAKYFIAIESDIKFEFDIVTNIQEINFSMPELSRILGIILDNAIEATLKCDNKYIKLEMKYDCRKNADIIKVYNTYDKNVTIDLKGIYEKGVSSKEVKSGIGLWEVKKLINRSKNSQIYATIEQDMFVQNIIIEKA